MSNDYFLQKILLGHYVVMGGMLWAKKGRKELGIGSRISRRVYKAF